MDLLFGKTRTSPGECSAHSSHSPPSVTAPVRSLPLGKAAFKYKHLNSFSPSLKVCSTRSLRPGVKSVAADIIKSNKQLLGKLCRSLQSQERFLASTFSSQDQGLISMVSFINACQGLFQNNLFVFC